MGAQFTLADQAEFWIAGATLDLECAVVDVADSAEATNLQRRIGRLMDRLHAVQLQAGEKADALLKD